MLMVEPSLALEAMRRLRDFMRSERWQSDSFANDWLKFAEQKVGVDLANELARSEDMKSIYRITFEPMQKAILHSNLSDYPSIYEPDATMVDGRGPEPGQFDITTSYEPWFATESLWHQDNGDLFASLVRKKMDVKIEGDSAIAISDCVLRNANETWVWHIQHKLQKSESGWRIHHQRTGLVGLRRGDKILVVKPADWKSLDETFRQADNAGDPRKSLYARITAWRLNELLKASEKVIDLPDVRPDDLALHSILALIDRNPEVMRQFGERAVREKPLVEGADYLRTLAVRMHSPVPPKELAPGVRVSIPTFYEVKNPRDTLGIPGRNLGTWAPVPSCLPSLFLIENEFEPNESLESSMMEIKKLVTTTYGATLKKFQEVKIGNTQGISVVLQGPGNGSSMIPGAANRDTLQSWVGIRRGNDLILFFLSSHKDGFNQRNAELKAIFESVEVE